jgi:hypothetical protein
MELHMRLHRLGLLSAVLLAACSAGPSSDQLAGPTDGQSLIKTLELADKNQDTTAIKELFKQDAVLAFPDELPFAGVDAIASVYEYFWQNQESKTLGFTVDRTENRPGQRIEYGRYVFTEGDSEQENIAFKAVFDTSVSPHPLAELVFGDKERISPRLPRPTGNYRVGRATHFRDKTRTATGRPMAFQVWYPASPGDEEQAVYQSAEISRTAAEFLGLPSFAFSFAPLVESHSFRQPPVLSKSTFPVLIYNHGYGGFTSVYQSVFVELASHGYIVVSVGHENESSLLVVDDDVIIKTDPQNEFYTSRAPELNGPEINPLQDIILATDDPQKNAAAYRQLVELSPLHNESTRLWATDTRAVIAELRELHAKDEKLKGAFELEAIGVIGHSVGGATAGELGFGDSGVSAGINLDGFQFGSLINNRLEIPFMFVSSNEQGDTYLRATSFMQNSLAVCYQATIRGLSHGSFTDLVLFSPGGERTIELQRDLILTFFNKHLKNIDVNLADLEARFPEITLSKNSNS